MVGADSGRAGPGRLRARIEAARGRRRADLVLRGGRVVNVFTGDIERADVAVHDGVVVGIGPYRGRRVHDVSSCLVLPGLIDSHVHIESTMLTPAWFARSVLPRGTTAVVADPHEIANVLGARGLRYFLRATRRLPLDVFFMLPSCVPSSPLESAGARLDAAALREFASHPRVLGLGEVMNFPGVLAGERELLRKLASFGDARIDGHAPGLGGRGLSAYAAAGISSDHESVTAAEAREKLRRGMTVFIRQGSSARNLAALLPLITPENSRFFAFATDDLQPVDLAGHSVGHIVTEAIARGCPPVTAVQMATINAARHFGLRRRGAVAPGWIADLVVVEDLRRFTVRYVFKGGRLAASRGRCRLPVPEETPPAGSSVRINALAAADFRLPARGRRVRLIEVVPGQIETRHRIVRAPSSGGLLRADSGRDIARLAVIERHRRTGRIGHGLVRGLGLREGAIASTVGHDAHNLIVAGIGAEEMAAAAREAARLRGGLVVAARGRIRASLPLPVAGLMSDRPLREVVRKLARVDAAARAIGVRLDHPFGTLSFLALPVIPELKLTDRGLVDVDLFRLVDLFT